MDFVVSPTAVALNNYSGGNAGMSSGQVVDAVVTRVIDAEHVQLSLGSSLVEAKTQVPLLPGMRVQLVVKTTPEGMQLVLLRPPDVSGASTPRAGVTTAGSEAPPPGTPGATAAAAATAGRSPSANPAFALASAARSAAATQDGLAPLFADAAVAAKLGGIPNPVREAVLRLLSFRLPVDLLTEADQLRRAVVRSGLFLEAHLGSAATAGSARQLATNTATANTATANTATANTAAANVATANVATANVATANVATANVTTANVAAANAATTDDLKAALVGLRAALKQWRAPTETTGAPLDRRATQVLPPVSAALPRPGPASAETLHKALLQAAGGGRATADAAQRHGTGPPSGESQPRAALPQRPPPPYSGALPFAQPAVRPSITGEVPLETIAPTLLAETEAALARHTLLQAASLPERPGLPLPQADGAGLRWAFEIPLGTPQGVAIAQFEIAEDRSGGGAEPAAPVWRVRFAIDIEPLGAVHAQVALMGERTAVTLWAERKTSAAQLRAEAPLLVDALRAAALDASDVIVREGSPRPGASAAAGHFLDRAS